MSHRAMVFWPPRRATLEEQGAWLWKTVAALQQCGGVFAEWSAIAPRTGTQTPVRGERDAVEVLRARTIHWQTGEARHTSYRARLTTTQLGGFATLDVTTGIEPMDLDRVFTPNRAEVTVEARGANIAPGTLQYMMTALVNGWRPLFGFAGTLQDPPAPEAIFSDGRPPVGWLTYLSRAYPPLPQVYPRPTTAYAMPEGTLVAAHPDLYDPADPAHAAAVERVRALLEHARVLVPHHQVGPR
jgi:hypothetical protein